MNFIRIRSLCLLLLLPASLCAQSVVLRHNIPARVQPQFDRGAADPSLLLPDLALLFKPSSRQQADLDQFLIDLQNPSSPDYHRWLTPEQFADRFSVNQASMRQVAEWLTAQGFQVS